MIPHKAAGIALLFLFGPWLSLGLFNIFISASLTLLGDAFAYVNRNMNDATRNLGASPSRVILDISIPLTYRGIISGCMLAWAQAVSSLRRLWL